MVARQFRHPSTGGSLADADAAENGEIPVDHWLRRALGIIYFYLWVKRANLRAKLERGTQSILLAYLLLIAIEVIAELYGRELGTHSLWWVRGVFWSLIAALILLKVREWNQHRQELYFIQAARKVVEINARLEGSDTGAVVQQLLEIFRTNFEGKRALNANLALPGDDGRLQVKYARPIDARYDGEVKFDPGEGGVGYCFKHQRIVYFPRIGLRHAVLQNIDESRPYRMREDLYKSCAVEVYRSVLSVPVTWKGTPVGVLNFDSGRSNAFRRIDFEQAMFFGFVLAVFLHQGTAGTPGESK